MSFVATIIITKSLFVEYMTQPKLAWRHLNAPEIYTAIQQKKYHGIQSKRIGDAVENAVLSFFSNKKACTIQREQATFANRHHSYDFLTQKALQSGAELIVQPGFLYEGAFCIADFLIKNGFGKRELMEVKSKRSIRRNNAAPLTNRLCADSSFQKYLLSKSMGSAFSGHVHLVYLNKEFIKTPQPIDESLLRREVITDECLSEQEIEETLLKMRYELALPVDEFDGLHPYEGDDYFTYFGEEPPAHSIRTIPGVQSACLQYCKLHGLSHLDEMDLKVVATLESAGLMQPRQADFVRSRHLPEEERIQTELLRSRLEELTFPLYCYDYEAVSTPIPWLTGTSPWQSVVVQYSLHVCERDGKVTHHQGLIEQASDQAHAMVVDQLLHDLGYGAGGTYLVWGKGFEISRNKEMGDMYDERLPAFQRINLKTRDLMEVFSEYMYFHKALAGSASLKDVAEFVTPLCYSGGAIQDGGEAALYLQELLFSDLNPLQQLTLQQQLLEYCARDSLALVEIIKFLMQKVSLNFAH